MKLFTLSLLMGALSLTAYASEVHAQAATEYTATTATGAGLAGKLGNKLNQSADRNLSSLQMDSATDSSEPPQRELVNQARMYPRGK